ncbi:MAG TPA: efflux RND transporter periplasmic adaptor subunit [Anaerolineales bacterium]|nr:efflux RND transporter periplasmic adaptor subunit [Anaerolineales bacterium]
MRNKNFPKARRAWYWIIGLIVVVAGLLVLPRLTFANATTAAAESSANVVSLDVAETVEASGSLEAQPLATLNWNTSGVVEEVYVNAGDKVKEGDVLMKLRTTSVSSNIISAQGDLVTAQEELEDLVSSSDTESAQAVVALKDAKEAYDKAVNYLQYLKTDEKVPQTIYGAKLVETRNGWKYNYTADNFKGPAPKEWIIEAENDLALKKAEWEDAQRTYDRLKDGPNAQDVLAAQAKVDAAQATVDSMSIIAPFDGEVLYVESQPGDLVGSDSFALNVANLDQLSVEAQVDESDIAKISVGDQVTAALDAVPGVTLNGKVTAINPVGEEVSGLVKYTVRVDLDKVDENNSLPLNATVSVVIQIKEASATLAVPITTIQNDSQGEYVLVVQSDGTTQRVDIVSGSIIGDLVAVTGDLKENDRISTESNQSQGPSFGQGGGG